MIKNKRSLEEAKTIFFDKYQSSFASIGEYQEKAIHFILKNYFECDLDKMEVKIDGMIADICNENGIIEIQTRNFDRLRKKLDVFLEKYDTTIVYPLIKSKKITWLNSENSADYNRKSPIHMNIFNAFKELYKIKTYLINKNLHFCFVFVDIVEFKNLDGYGKDKKKKASSFNKLPINISEIINFDSFLDFKNIFDGSEGEFTSKSLAKMKKIKLKDAQVALTVLSYLGIVEKIGKDGRSFIYKLHN